MHRLILHSYSGMRFEIATGDRNDCERSATRVLRRFRKKHGAFAVLESRTEWELLEPNDCAIIPDDCGILEILAPRSVPCKECGSRVEETETGKLVPYCSPCCFAAYSGGSCECDSCLEFDRSLDSDVGVNTDTVDCSESI